ncbi:MAG: murein biosynthesis integral membrane protein MurJ [Campylobacterota bacterium]|nr:murein biosynthesis integral membrane protein MurJ [Campylobacterota bacterium]
MLKNIFTNSAGILVSRILGFIRDLLTASILGANIYSDIFFVAFKLPNLFRRIFAEGAFTQVFIPAYARDNHKIQFSSIIFLQFISFILFLTIIVTLFASLITKAIAVGFDTNTVDLATPLVAICFYYLPLIFIVTFLAALLQYKHHFATTSFGTALLNISLIFALIISADMEKYDIVYYMSWGVVVGGILQVIAHIIAIKKLNIKFLSLKYIKSYFKNKKRDISQSKFYKQFYPAVFGSSSAHIAAFLDTWLASFLLTGSISYLYYANRVFQLPLALFAIATSIALFPTIAKAIKNKDEQKALIYLRKAFYILLLVLGLSTFIGIIFSEFIVSLLFERGAFSVEDTKQTSLVLTMYLIGLLPFGLAKIFSLWLYSYEKQVIAAKITMKSLGWNIIFSLALILPYGIVGLALASSLSGFILLYLTIQEFGYDRFKQLIKYKKEYIIYDK